jgi:hypothetical protein
MAYTPPARHTSYNSNDATEDSNQTLYGKHIPRTNVNSSPGSLCKTKSSQLTTRIGPSPVPIVPSSQRDLESCADLGAFWCTTNPAIGPTNRNSCLVGGSGCHNPKATTTTFQRSGDLHDVEHLERKKQKDFSKHCHERKTGGLQNQRRHWSSLTGL